MEETRIIVAEFGHSSLLSPQISGCIHASPPPFNAYITQPFSHLVIAGGAPKNSDNNFLILIPSYEAQCPVNRVKHPVSPFGSSG
ncbi:hypothetical protein TIFTF001_055367 [Ficus carica]|uniref:Uncharacterized protein n=1 Tax=Ficus carica TaxID=3494 RepID=A0AA88EFJ6_FICCA|nr:hypothetical protein TIFTF001_055367 [Ficus carica]